MRPEDSAARCAANEEDEDDEGTADDDEEDDEDNEDDDDPSVASDMVTSPLGCSSGVSDSSTMRTTSPGLRPWMSFARSR